MQSQSTLLDEVLIEDDAPTRIALAETNKFSDIWETNGKPPRIMVANVSREGREIIVAKHILNKVNILIKAMTPDELMECIKTYDLGDTNSIGGVAYLVYRDGNAMIINEIRNRGVDERASLVHYFKDKREIFTGDCGHPCTIGDIARALFEQR